MREIVVGKGIKPGVRIDGYILSTFPALSKNALYKAFRKKDVKIGGVWVAPDAAISPSDVLSIYLRDEVLFGAAQSATTAARLDTTAAQSVLPAAPPAEFGGFQVVYEDERLLVVNKAPGLPVHPDRSGGGYTLIELAREYLSGSSADGFAPAMCHRIDRNTGGLVVIAKDGETLELMLEKISSGEIKKEYRCIAAGRPDPPEATLRGYLIKNSSRGTVTVLSGGKNVPDYALNIVTRYKTIGYNKKSDASKLEVSLLTGRTHQIRAHLASIGHPIIGDGKYCPGNINKKYDVRFQMLTAFRLKFPTLPGQPVSGITVEIPDGLEFPRFK